MSKSDRAGSGNSTSIARGSKGLSGDATEQNAHLRESLLHLVRAQDRLPELHALNRLISMATSDLTDPRDGDAVDVGTRYLGQKLNTLEDELGAAHAALRGACT